MKLTSSTSLPHRPAQRPSEEVTTGTELQLKHADISQAAPVHKGQRHPGQLTQGAGVREGCTSLFFPVWRGEARPSAQHRQALTPTFPDALTFCTAVPG